MRKSAETGSGPSPFGNAGNGWHEETGHPTLEPEAADSLGSVASDPVGARKGEGVGTVSTLAESGDARLVERARGGDDEAFAALVGRYERKLIRVLARLVRDGELARDLAQETFWRVYNRLDRFDTARRFGPWLFRVGVNLGLDWLRRHDVPTAAPVSIDRPSADGRGGFDLPDPDPRIRAELAQEVQFILARIPVAYRTILVLRDLEEFSSAEVAAIVNRREATVRWRLARARDMFREHWERRDGATLMPPRREVERS